MEVQEIRIVNLNHLENHRAFVHEGVTFKAEECNLDQAHEKVRVKAGEELDSRLAGVRLRDCRHCLADGRALEVITSADVQEVSAESLLGGESS